MQKNHSRPSLVLQSVHCRAVVSTDATCAVAPELFEGLFYIKKREVLGFLKCLSHKNFFCASTFKILTTALVQCKFVGNSRNSSQGGAKLSKGLQRTEDAGLDTRTRAAAVQTADVLVLHTAAQLPPLCCRPLTLQKNCPSFPLQLHYSSAQWYYTDIKQYQRYLVPTTNIYIYILYIYF